MNLHPVQYGWTTRERDGFCASEAGALQVAVIVIGLSLGSSGPSSAQNLSSASL